MDAAAQTKKKKSRRKKGKGANEQGSATEAPGRRTPEPTEPRAASNPAPSAAAGGPGGAIGNTGTGPGSTSGSAQVPSSSGTVGKQGPMKHLLPNPVQSKDAKQRLPPGPMPGRRAQQPILPRPEQAHVESQLGPTKAAQGREVAKMGRGNAPVQDNTALSLQDSQGQDMFLMELERENIHLLKRKSIKFPKAMYFCRTCEYHLDRPEDCRNHIKDNRHKRATEITAAANILKVIPTPRPKHIEKLTEMLLQIYAEHGLGAEDVKIRQSCVVTLQDFIKKEMAGVNAKLRMYGSSFTGLGLKDCDINVDLYIPKVPIKPRMLQDLHKLADAKLKTGEVFASITCNFSSLVPTLLLTDKETGLICQVAVACYTSCLSSHLLKAYSCLDPRVAPLCVAFRYWARLCKVDKHDYGTLPPYAYDLMMLHYLQRTLPPVLPYLSKNLPQYDPKNPKEDECDWFVEMKMEAEDWQSANTESLGGLWLGMLRYYCLTFDVANKVVTLSKATGNLKELKCFHRKKLGIDDPYLLRRNVARTLFNNRIHDYLQDCLRQSFLYFALPRDRQGESYIPLERLKAWVKEQKTQDPEKAVAFEKSCKPDAGELEGKKSQDPRLLNDSNNACLPDRERDLYGDHDNDDADVDVVADSVRSITFTNSSCQNPDSPVEKTAPEDGLLQRLEKTAITGVETSPRDEYADSIASAIIDSALHGGKLDTSAAAAAAASSESNDAKMSDDELDCHYEFIARNLAIGDGPVVICSYCDKEGHLKMNCPEDKIPPPDPLPPLTADYVKFLNEVLRKVPGDFMPSDADLARRQTIVRDLEQYIRKIYADASLQLFGSSRNGFVFRQSDLDICITFAKKSPEDVDPVQVIEKLARHLRQCRELDNVTPITTAKVPIVKFTIRDGSLDGDISVYNILAQHNTNLLDCYSRIDKRVQILGYLIKVFVKICEIGDASKGSLSSYAYILMVLHFLQQRSPPVIPVLQELYSGEKPERLVEGWNAWFYDDLDNLPHVWEDYGKNKESVAELWIGLFKYYTEQFSCKEHVVCARQREILTRFEKLWNGSCLAIEDPFELSHNLGTGLNKRMNNFIFTILQRGRTLYGTPVDADAWRNKCATPQDYFFDNNVLRTSAPPNDRGCRICGRIGHIAKKCTNAMQNRDNLGKKGSKVAGAGNDRKKGQACYNCSDSGHIARDCPKNNVDWSRNNSGLGAVASPMTQGMMPQVGMMPPNMAFARMPVPQFQMGRPRPVPLETSRGSPHPSQHGRGPYPGPDTRPGGGGSGGQPARRRRARWEGISKAYMTQPALRPNLTPWMPQYSQEGHARDHSGQKSPRS